MIARVDQRLPDLRWPMPEDLVQVLTGARVTALRRRSKYILADLDRGGSLLLHLGMSGRVRIEGAQLGNFHQDPTILPQHDHLVLTTDEGTTVTLNDARRFGAVDLVRDGQDHPLLAALGPEPIDPDFTPARLAAALAGRRSSVKAALLDQRIVAGLGNIYVCEALHRARGQIRKIVGDELGVRFTPTIAFEQDTVPEASARMEELRNRARERDAELAKLRANATPAGEGNPYKNTEL